MNKIFYPAVFHPEHEDGGFSVFFPDLVGCYSQGENLEEAVSMAEEALGLYLNTMQEMKKTVPAPFSKTPELEGDDFTTLVKYDEAEYLRKTDTRSIKKTVTIPAWLDTLARKKNVNFSNTLQNALCHELGVQMV